MNMNWRKEEKNEENIFGESWIFIQVKFYLDQRGLVESEQNWTVISDDSSGWKWTADDGTKKT